MTSSTTSNVYIHVIEDVISKVRHEFNTNGGGPGDSVLTELQGIWEMKMMQAQAISVPVDPPSAEASSGTGGYETPTTEMLQTPFPDVKPVLGYMQPAQRWANQNPNHRPDVNVAYVGEEEQDFFPASAAAGKRKRDEFFIPQQDGATDVQDDNVEEALNEDVDDDDEYDDVDQEDDDVDCHMVLAQFEKVSHTKSRWKCILRDGIVHINNKDILFNKATGEFDF